MTMTAKLKDQYNNTRYAYPVGDYLCAMSFVEGYKIYRMKGKSKPFIDVTFFSLEECMSAIKIFYKIYGEYFPIWETKDWEDANVPALCQWTVLHGVKLNEMIQRAEKMNKAITMSELFAEEIC
jgi:hypothetical protein